MFLQNVTVSWTISYICPDVPQRNSRQLTRCISSQRVNLQARAVCPPYMSILTLCDVWRIETVFLRDSRRFQQNNISQAPPESRPVSASPGYDTELPLKHATLRGHVAQPASLCRNKQSLLTWKVAKTQLLADMESRVKKFEKWSHHDVDKLLLDIEKKVLTPNP